MQARIGTATNGLAARIVTQARQFRRDEGGVLIIFGLMIFVLMLMIGGIALDVMRTESVRVRLANTSDRCTLAAAALSNTQLPVDTVTDCFAKAGLSSYLKGVSVLGTNTSRIVTADVGADIPTMVMHMLGIDTLNVPADSTAEQSASNLEITLVLDVSGSMTWGTKLDNLKTAANNFVDTVLAGDVQNRISISIVPFNGQVNLGPVMAAEYNISNQHSLNTCVDVAPADFNTPAILATTPLTRSDVLDPWSGWITKNKPNGVTDQNYCTTDARTVVRPFLRDIPTLRAVINGLVAEGNTSIDVGVKWGVAMLDPGSRPIINNLIGAGVADANFAGRPFAYGAARTNKAIVVMSDGENTPQYQLQATYKSGPSPVFADPNTGAITVHHPTVAGANKYYVIAAANLAGDWQNATLGVWQAAPPNGSVQLDWPAVTERFTVYGIASRLFGNALSTNAGTRVNIANNMYNNMMTAVGSTTKDSQLDQVCDMAKSPALGIRVFTVAFEAPLPGQTALANCASSAGDYFAVAGPEIITAFQSIALQMSQLRLTQ